MSDDVERAGRVALRTGRAIGAVFCLIFLTAGLSFGWRLALETWENGQPYLWKSTPCRILKAEVVPHGSQYGAPYSIAVSYEYVWGSHALVSENFTTRPRKYSEHDAAQLLLAKYRPGELATCLVNPERPQEAVLQKQGLWSGVFLLVPLLLVVLGAGGFYGAVFGVTQQADPVAAEPEGPLSSGQRRRKAPTGILVLFFFLFFAVGVGTLYATFIRPLLRVQAAQGWAQIPCEVISSEVQSHRGNKGSVTYTVEIVYEYQAGGQTHRSSRYSFAMGSSSGRSAKQKIVDQYRPGSRSICFVNPADPTDAVLERNLVKEVWFGLIPLVFVLVGVGGMGFVLRQRIVRPPGMFVVSSPQAQGSPGQDVVSRDAEIVLRATGPRAGKFIATLVFALFWNGIVSVFVYQVAQSIQRGSTEWFLAILLLPFVAVGLFMIGLAAYFFLGMFAPRAVLKLGSGAIPLGGSTELTWQFEGRAHSIERLTILVTGREEVTYRSGNRTANARNQFARIEVTSATARDEIQSGRALITIPPDVMHSFTSRNNRIVWTLHVRGVIRWYPDVHDEFVLTVLPSPEAARRDAA